MTALLIDPRQALYRLMVGISLVIGRPAAAI
jgi:hypothetical protein